MWYIPRTEIVQISSCAGLVYTTCEWLSCLTFEINHIWRDSDFPFHLRCIYILAQYAGLFGQIEYIISFNYLVKATSTSRLICNIYWSFQQYTCAFSMVLVSFLTLKRVHALWNNNFWIGVLAFLLLALHIVSSLVFGTIGIWNVRYTECNCFALEHFPKEIMYWAGIEVFIQTSIWGLGFTKCMSFRQALENVNTLRLLSRVRREGSVIALLVSAVPACIVADGIWTKLAPQMTLIIYLAFPAFLAITTSTTCRSIKSMHQLSKKMVQENQSSSGLEEGLILTSVGFY